MGMYSPSSPKLGGRHSSIELDTSATKGGLGSKTQLNSTKQSDVAKRASKPHTSLGFYDDDDMNAEEHSIRDSPDKLPRTSHVLVIPRHRKKADVSTMNKTSVFGQDSQRQHNDS